MVACPLIDLDLVRRTRSGLLGATVGYLVLFGPLVLIPQILTVHELVRLIREAGRRPIERDTVFNKVREW